MIIFDNTVLSAFTRLKLLPSLEILLKSAIISKEILNEFSLQWQQTIPNWIKILQSDNTIILKDIPKPLSSADLSLIRLALEYDIPIASDDGPLRTYAKKLGISITGSLGLLKALNQKKIIETQKEYIKFLNLLQEDIYISDELMKWALKD
jgi:predicted nucleic acid-binding protein